MAFVDLAGRHLPRTSAHATDAGFSMPSESELQAITDLLRRRTTPAQLFEAQNAQGSSEPHFDQLPER